MAYKARKEQSSRSKLFSIAVGVSLGFLVVRYYDTILSFFSSLFH